MSESQMRKWRIAGKDVLCSHCGWDRMWLRPTLMNTSGATFFGFDWANKEANALVCERCTRIDWFFANPDPR